MAAKCRSWKPGKKGCADELHLPGSCRRCWVPCRNGVAAKNDRCHDCTMTIATHRNASVRLSLAYEPDLDITILRVLATDPNDKVAEAAQRGLVLRWDPSTLTSTVHHG